MLYTYLTSWEFSKNSVILWTQELFILLMYNVSMEIYLDEMMAFSDDLDFGQIYPQAGVAHDHTRWQYIY